MRSFPEIDIYNVLINASGIVYINLKIQNLSKKLFYAIFFLNILFNNNILKVTVTFFNVI